MVKISIKLALTAFKKNNKAFTLLEVMMVIVLMGILVVMSYNFSKYAISYYKKEEAVLLSSIEEKIALEYFKRDIISAGDINIIGDENEAISFNSFYKGELTNITYKIYESSSKLALGKKTNENFQAVINNVENLNFSRKKDLLKVEFKLINSLGEERKVYMLITPRLEGSV